MRKLPSILILGLSLGIVGCGTSATASSPPKPTKECATAVERVNAYKAPGQTADIQTNIQTHLSAERRPVQAQGWDAVETVGNRCWATFRATIGNESRQFTWELDPKTGAVAARDDATKRLSGW